MVIRAAIIFAAGIAFAGTYSPLEVGLLTDLNQLRANPAAWANVLKAERPWSPGKVRVILGDDTAAATLEAVRDLEEAIGALESVHGSLPRVEISPGLSRAAADHVRDTGSRGLTSHIGADGSSLRQRIERYGTWTGEIAENIVYSTAGPRELLFQQLVDFGVTNRGHRLTLLNPAWHYAGIACGPHTVYRTMCVLDFASNYEDFHNGAPARGGRNRTNSRKSPLD